MNDLKFALRMLLKNPGFTAVAVLTLALGIGANTAVFSLVNAVLLRPLPFPEPDRLLFLSERSRHLDNMSIAYLNLKDWQEQNQAFAHLGAFRSTSYNLTGGEQPERIDALQVSASFFPALGVGPIQGRVFRQDEDKPGAVRVAVLSEGLWRRRFGGDSNILNQVLQLDGQPYAVVGIMPATFQFPRTTELWTPLGLNADGWQQRGNHPGIYAVARMKTGVTLAQARAEMESLTARLAQQYPDSNTGNSATVMTLRERMAGQIRSALLILFAAVGFVLLIACANLANLLLARAATRHKEMAVRAALGAGRRHLVTQLLVESVLLALIGAAFGLVFALGGVSGLSAMVPRNVSQLIEIRPDASVLLFTLVLAVLTGVLFGLAPAWQILRADLNETLKEGGRSGGLGVGHSWLRRVLVVSEVALALVLLAGAGLMIRSFGRVQSVSPGFDPSRLLTLNLSLPSVKYTNVAQRAAFYQALVERLSALPGVQSAGLTSFLPVQGGSQSSYSVEGEPPAAPGQSLLADYVIASPDYFTTMKIPLLRGRAFTNQDTEQVPRVAIVDETFVKKHWPRTDPIGRRFQYGDGRGTNWWTVVGVVGHVKNYGVDADSRVETYLPFPQNAPAGARLVLRSVTPPHTLANAVRGEVRALDQDLPITNVRTMEEILADSVATRRLSMTLLGTFATVALALAGVGIYGVMAYSVNQRTREIGVRMALGARRVDVLRLVLRRGLTLAGLGLAVGLASAVALSTFLTTQLFGIEPTDLPTYLSITLLLGTVALLACYLPARRATQVDPMEALRYE